MTTEKWREDIEYLNKELPKRHLNLYHTTPKSKFDRAFKNLLQGLSKLKDHEIAVELSRIAAMIGDGHSGLRLYSDLKKPFQSYPIRFYFYEDGLFVRKIDRRFAKFAGARVVKIGNLSTEKAIEAVTPLISRDNEMWIKFYAPYFLATPEVLDSLKIINDIGSAKFELEINGRRETISLTPKGKLFLSGHAQTDKGMEEIELVDARKPSTSTPLWLKGDPENSYWFEYLKDSKTVYFRYNVIQNKKKESIREFANRMFGFIENNDVDRLVVDMRWNRGGDNKLSRPLLLGIIKSKKIDQRGKLFLITGRRTFSAAQYIVNEMEMYTNVTRVGEPTASNVNPYGDTFKIILPNSGIKVRASFVRFEQMGPWDKRKWTSPHIAAELTSTDYREGTDPALEAILDYKPADSLDRQMKKAISQDGLAAAVRLYRQFKKDRKNKYINTETSIYTLGFELIEETKLREAVKIFTLNTEEYPNEFVSFYGLGETYEKTNQLKLARDNYERAYRLAEEKNDDRVAQQLKAKYESVSSKISKVHPK